MVVIGGPIAATSRTPLQVSEGRERARLELTFRCAECADGVSPPVFETVLRPGDSPMDVRFGSLERIAGESGRTDLVGQIPGGVISPAGGFMPATEMDGGVAGPCTLSGQTMFVTPVQPWSDGSVATQMTIENGEQGATVRSASMGGTDLVDSSGPPRVKSGTARWEGGGHQLSYCLEASQREVTIVAEFDGGLWRGLVGDGCQRSETWLRPGGIPVDQILGGVTFGGG